MKRLLLLVPTVSMMLAGTMLAGEVKIGLSPFGSAGGSKTCHVTTFYGPAEAIVAYRVRQEERFEEVDSAVVEHLRRTVSIFVEVQDRCSRDGTVPEKVVITARGKREPLLTIRLEEEAVSFKNRMGAEFTGYNARGEVHFEEIRALAGEDYDFHLIFDGKKPYKDKWKKKYAEKILN